MKTTNITKLFGIVMATSVISATGVYYNKYNVFGVELPQRKSIVVNNVEHDYVENSLQDTFSPHMENIDSKINVAKSNNEIKNYTDIMFDRDVDLMHKTHNIL